MKMTNKIALIGALALAIISQPAHGMEYFQACKDYCSKKIKKHPLISAGIALTALGLTTYYIYNQDDQSAPEKKDEGYLNQHFVITTEPVVKTVHQKPIEVVQPKETLQPVIENVEIPKSTEQPKESPSETTLEELMARFPKGVVKLHNSEDFKLPVQEEVKPEPTVVEEIDPKVLEYVTNIKSFLPESKPRDWLNLLEMLDELNNTNKPLLIKVIQHNNYEVLTLSSRLGSIAFTEKWVSLEEIHNIRTEITRKIELLDVQMDSLTKQQELLCSQTKPTPTVVEIKTEPVVKTEPKVEKKWKSAKEYVEEIKPLFPKATGWKKILTMLNELNEENKPLLQEVIRYNTYEILLTDVQKDASIKLRNIALGEGLLCEKQLRIALKLKNIEKVQCTGVTKFKEALAALKKK